MKDLRFYLRARNNRLVTLREQLGKSAPALAAAIGAPYTEYIAIETLRRSPITTEGEWRSIAVKIADFHGVGCDELWPGSMRQVRFTRTVEWQCDVRALPESQRHLLSPADQYDETERQTLVSIALDCLPIRQAKILELYYGLGDNEPHTHEAIAQVLGLSVQRVRQLRIKALDKLRSPEKIGPLANALSESW